VSRYRIVIGVFLVAALFSAVASDSLAYTINTGFTDPCHERMTYRAAKDLFASGLFKPESSVQVPTDDVWEAVSDYITRTMNLEFESDAQKFTVVSFMIGARYPDNRGKSITNVQSLREVHRDPNRQKDHFLREVGDDYSAGNELAIERGLDFIRFNVEAMREARNFPPAEQVVKIPLYVEFYGMVDVKIWAPAFRLGIATHAVQDSFSHTIRSDDLHRIRHVMNYVDAVTYSYKQDRDGLRHSWAMDRCKEEAVDIAAGALEATTDFLAIISSDDNVMAIDLERFFDDWMVYEQGCNAENDFCNSRWAEIARMDPSLPVLEEVFDCSQAPGSGTMRFIVIFLAVAIALITRRIIVIARNRISR